MTKEQEKHFKILQLLPDIDNRLVNMFFDVESFENLDEKLEVLTALKNGQDVGERLINILELYPKDGQIWD